MVILSLSSKSQIVDTTHNRMSINNISLASDEFDFGDKLLCSSILIEAVYFIGTGNHYVNQTGNHIFIGVFSFVGASGIAMMIDSRKYCKPVKITIGGDGVGIRYVF